MTLFEALTGGAFDRLNWQHSGEFDRNSSKKSNGLLGGRGGGAMGGFGIDRYINRINRGYYTVARRYEFYFRVAKQYFTNERSE